MRRALVGAGGAALAAQYVPAVVALGQWAPVRALPGGLCRWRGPGRPAVALTFDDGPHPEGTPRVAEALGRLGLRATFFCLGSEAERYPDLVAELRRAGHQVETHGYRHEHHLARSPRWVLEDLRRAVAVHRTLGVPARWYRPTYGQATGTTLLAARCLGLRPVLWSSWGREWATTNVAEVTERVTAHLRPGAIVLLHDSDAHGRPGMWRVGLGALEGVAADLEGRGLEAVTLDRLMGAGDPGPGPGGALT